MTVGTSTAADRAASTPGAVARFARRRSLLPFPSAGWAWRGQLVPRTSRKEPDRNRSTPAARSWTMVGVWRGRGDGAGHQFVAVGGPSRQSRRASQRSGSCRGLGGVHDHGGRKMGVAGAAGRRRGRRWHEHTSRTMIVRRGEVTRFPRSAVYLGPASGQDRRYETPCQRNGGAPSRWPGQRTAEQDVHLLSFHPVRSRRISVSSAALALRPVSACITSFPPSHRSTLGEIRQQMPLVSAGVGRLVTCAAGYRRVRRGPSRSLIA